MKKVLIRGLEKLNNLAKKVAESSTNTVSTFLYYEPKAPKNLKNWEYSSPSLN